LAHLHITTLKISSTHSIGFPTKKPKLTAQLRHLAPHVITEGGASSEDDGVPIHVGSRMLSTLLNAARNIAEGVLGLCGLRLGCQAMLTIPRDVSGVVRPSWATLLLGSPSSGETMLLLALDGKLDKVLRSIGDITYNGFALHEFVPQKTSAYISRFRGRSSRQIPADARTPGPPPTVLNSLTQMGGERTHLWVRSTSIPVGILGLLFHRLFEGILEMHSDKR
jgi:hypothetical protein